MSGGVPLQASIVEVLEQSWAWGLDPSQMGQMILRPRIVSTCYPPILRGGEEVEEFRDEAYWVIEATGAVVPGLYPRREPPYRYMSTKIMFMQDTALGVMQSYYRP
jgi:hypothetical protein